jgi:hypothetical protein
VRPQREHAWLPTRLLSAGVEVGVEGKFGESATEIASVSASDLRVNELTTSGGRS